MLKARINTLVDLLPPAATIYSDREGGGAAQTDVVTHRRAHALLDPAFAWAFAQAFVQLDLPLPELVYEPYIKLAYAHASGRVRHEDVAESLIIRHPKWHVKRSFLEALLLLDLRLDEVAAYVGLSVSVVMAYEQLFWNVRDRRQDPMLMSELCFPETRLVEYRGDGEYWNNAEPRDLLLRAAYNGDLKTVLQIFGSRTAREELPAAASMKRLKTRIFSDAEFVVASGGGCSKAPVLDAAKKLLMAGEKFAQSENKYGDDVMGLTAVGLSMGGAIMDELRRQIEGIQPDHTEKLARLNAACKELGIDPATA